MPEYERAGAVITDEIEEAGVIIGEGCCITIFIILITHIKVTLIIWNPTKFFGTYDSTVEPLTLWGQYKICCVVLYREVVVLLPRVCPAYVLHIFALHDKLQASFELL